jgi:hypothetical protein
MPVILSARDEPEGAHDNRRFTPQSEFTRLCSNTAGGNCIPDPRHLPLYPTTPRRGPGHGLEQRPCIARLGIVVPVHPLGQREHHCLYLLLTDRVRRVRLAN